MNSLMTMNYVNLCCHFYILLKIALFVIYLYIHTHVYMYISGAGIRRKHKKGTGHFCDVLTVIGAPQLCSVHNTDVGESSVSHASPMELKF